MTDKRNIVIKVSYPVTGKAAQNKAPRMVTEWNVKRILFAAAALVLLLASVIYSISHDAEKADTNNAELLVNTAEQSPTSSVDAKETETKILDIPKQVVVETNSVVKPKNESNKKTAGIPAKEVINKQAKEKIIKEHGYSKVNPNVRRALLTYAINNKEPAGEVVKAVDVSRKKPVWLYYFTELKAMKGNKVYHEWLKNGTVVSRQELVILDDTWRTSSRKLLSESEKGNWAVRLVDKSGRLLNEQSFKVE